MKDISTFKLDVDRIIVQLLIPGLTVVVPWAFVLYESHTAIGAQLIQKHGIGLIVLIGLAVGLMLENIGSQIEASIFDSRNKSDDPQFEKIWEAFLKIQIEEGKDYIAHQYLRTILTRMKFELSYCIALLTTPIPLLYFLHFNHNYMESSCIAWFLFLILPITISIWMYTEAKNSSKLLHKNRKWIIQEEARKKGMNMENYLNQICEFI